jgi:hypothetical protein
MFFGDELDALRWFDADRVAEAWFDHDLDAAAGIPDVHATIAVTARKATAAMAGREVFEGSTVVTARKATASMTGRLVLRGSLVASARKAIASFLGRVVFSGSLVASARKATAAIVGTVTNPLAFHATIVTTARKAVAAILGTVTNPPPLDIKSPGGARFHLPDVPPQPDSPTPTGGQRGADVVLSVEGMRDRLEAERGKRAATAARAADELAARESAIVRADIERRRNIPPPIPLDVPIALVADETIDLRDDQIPPAVRARSIPPALPPQGLASLEPVATDRSAAPIVAPAPNRLLDHLAELNLSPEEEAWVLLLITGSV